MPEVYKDAYGRRVRPDNQPGYIVITPTKIKFHEADGTDVRLDRVRVFDGKGKLARCYLMDKMGAPFADNLPDSEDDIGYLENLKKQLM